MAIKNLREAAARSFVSTYKCRALVRHFLPSGQVSCQNYNKICSQGISQNTATGLGLVVILIVQTEASAGTRVFTLVVLYNFGLNANKF